MMKYYCRVFMLLIVTFWGCYQKKHLKEGICDNLRSTVPNQGNSFMVTINMKHNGYHYETQETNIFYFTSVSDSIVRLKIHTIRVTNTEKEQVDTAYILSSNQWYKIDEIYRQIKNGYVEPYPLETFQKGTKTRYTMIIGDKTYYAKGKSRESIAFKLLECPPDF